MNFNNTIFNNHIKCICCFLSPKIFIAWKCLKKNNDNTKENIHQENFTSFNVQATVMAGRRAKESING